MALSQMFEMSQTLISHNINLPSEEMAPLKSQNVLQKLSAGSTWRSLRSESSFSGEKKIALADITIFLMLTVLQYFKKQFRVRRDKQCREKVEGVGMVLFFLL